MSDITKSGNAQIDAMSANRCVVLSELFAGEDLAKADACYIKNDGLVYKAVASGVTPFDGFTLRAVYSGQPVSLYGQGAIFGYGSEMTPGSFAYVSETAGALADAAAGSEEPVAKVISTTDILVIR